MKLLPKSYYDPGLSWEKNFNKAIFDFENKLYTVKEFINYLRKNQEDVLENHDLHIVVFDDMICKYNIKLYGKTKMIVDQWFLDISFPIRIPYIFIKSKLYVNAAEIHFFDFSDSLVYCYIERSKKKAMQDIQDKNKYAEYYKLSIIHNFKKKLEEII